MKTYVISRNAQGHAQLERTSPGFVRGTVRVPILGPSHFDFGYVGGGPVALARAILLDCFRESADPKAIVVDCAASFAITFLGPSVRELRSFSITQREILRWFSNKTLAGVRA
jgi:hypothetical protein